MNMNNYYILTSDGKVAATVEGTKISTGEKGIIIFKESELVAIVPSEGGFAVCKRNE